MSGGETQKIEDPYTVKEKVITVMGETGRPEVFVEVRRPEMGPGTDVTLIRDSDALELYEELGEYLRSEGYDV